MLKITSWGAGPTPLRLRSPLGFRVPFGRSPILLAREAALLRVQLLRDSYVLSHVISSSLSAFAEQTLGPREDKSSPQSPTTRKK